LQWVALPLGLLICASTVLVKQHSILDVFVAIPVSAVLYFIVYHRAFRKKRKHA
jgi:membrane-associated phospholipid phosphatase